MTTYIAADRAFRAGRFVDATRLLDGHRAESADDAVFTLELGYFLGKANESRRQARALLDSGALGPLAASKCASVLASQYNDDGDFGLALEFSRRAADLAERSEDLAQISATTCALLEQTCNRAVFNASLPLALLARRVSIRTGLPQSMAATHLTFGRLEARAGHFDSAHRHFSVCRELLGAAPNLWLSASVDLDESAVLSLRGEMGLALEMATRAAEVAEQSGWSKGIVAAAANSAFCCVSLSRLEEAQCQLRRAFNQLFKSPSYELALAETEAQLAFASGNYDLAEQIIRKHEGRADTVQPWYELSGQETLIRILLRQQRWTEALERSEAALVLAREAGVEPFVTGLRVARADALLGAGKDSSHVGSATWV